jgi:hypothetical protein
MPGLSCGQASQTGFRGSIPAQNLVPQERFESGSIMYVCDCAWVRIVRNVPVFTGPQVNRDINSPRNLMLLREPKHISGLPIVGNASDNELKPVLLGEGGYLKKQRSGYIVTVVRCLLDAIVLHFDEVCQG